MKWIISLALFGLVAFGSHFLTVRGLPGLIMGKAQTMLDSQGIPQYQWVASPRQTPQTQRVVRPSPDLSYAVCRFDVRDGPVVISAPAWDGYGSLSVFDDQTNNVFVANLDGEDGKIILHKPRQAPLEDGRGYVSAGQPVIELSGTGIALIRRLAPTEERHEASMALVADAVCEQINWR